MPMDNPEAYMAMNPIYRGTQRSPSDTPNILEQNPQILQLLALMSKAGMGPAADSMARRPTDNPDLRLRLLQALLQNRGVNPREGGPQALSAMIRQNQPQGPADASVGGDTSRALLKSLLAGRLPE